MPRGRILDKEAISHSRTLSLLPNDTGRLIYTWLLPHLDREGRFSADPAVIKGNIFPRIKKMTISKIEKSIKEMAYLKLIILYQIDGDRYLQFKKFKEFQTHLEREAPSKIPVPNKENIINSGFNPTKSDLVPLKQYNTIQYNPKEVVGVNPQPVENSNCGKLKGKESFNYAKGMEAERGHLKRKEKRENVKSGKPELIGKSISKFKFSKEKQ